ncbi:MAG: hypothetical protein ACOY4K_12725 [Pseudomonadota bacterium]
MLRDRVFFPLCLLAAAAMIALALAWPRGMGAAEPSLGPAAPPSPPAAPEKAR